MTAIINNPSQPVTSGAEPSAVIGEVHTRFNRQLDFVPPLSLEEKEVTVIGVGAIGRQVALQLAAIGCRKIRIIDFDTVSETNVTTQGFLEGDVTKEKVHAVEDSIKAVDKAIEVESVCDRFRPKHIRAEKAGTIYFICVDSIEARTAIYEQIKDKVELIVDGRMLGEIMRIIVANDKPSHEHYKSTLFSPEKVVQGRCTGHATIYCATIAAGLMIHQFTRTLRGFPIDMDMGMNLLTGEFSPCE